MSIFSFWLIIISATMGPLTLFLIWRLTKFLESPICPYCNRLAKYHRGGYTCRGCGRKAERHTINDSWFIRRKKKPGMKDTDLEHPTYGNDLH